MPLRHVAGALIVATTALAVGGYFLSAAGTPPSPMSVAGPMPPAPVAVAAATPAAPPLALVAPDGTPVPPEKLRGRWTIVFSPTEPCSALCSSVMETLSAVARDPASGIQDGVAQILLTRPSVPDASRDLVVLDPEGHNAGILAHTTDPGRIVSGLATLRAAFASPAPSIASR